jgi:glycosyltransferase involved in cell wall biosynthesis
MPNPDSGAAGTEYQTVAAMRHLGCDVDCVWADSLPHRIAHGNLHYLLELPIAYRVAMLARMKRKDYDVIHVNQPHGYLAAKALAKSGKPAVFIHRSHGFELRAAREFARWRQRYPSGEQRLFGRSRVRRMMAKLLARHGLLISRHANGHIVSASECSRFLRDAMGVSAVRIAVIPQAAPQAYLESPLREMTRARAKRLLYVGQYDFYKAPMVLAAAINRLVECDQECSVTWVTSRSAHAAVRNLLSEEARSRVTLLGWMPQQDLMDVYDGHGIFLFPSFFEGFGKAFLEAMSRGLCVVAADNGGARDTIRRNENGVLTPTGDVAAMVEACMELLKPDDRVRELGDRAALDSRRYTWHRVARETIAFYQDRLEFARQG